MFRTFPYRIIEGDCFDVLGGIESDFADSVVTAPRYNAPSDISGFLSCWGAGKRYISEKDAFKECVRNSLFPCPEVWREVLRVLKPGGHMLVFAGTQLMDLACLAIRLAGFELRDTVFYASESSVVAPKEHPGLKSTLEPIFLVRKPMPGSIVDTVATHGCGALNIDACRVEIDASVDASQLRMMTRSKRNMKDGWGMNSNTGAPGTVVSIKGRFPSNFSHDGSDAIISLFPKNIPSSTSNLNGAGHSDVLTGSASRFFKSFTDDEEFYPTVKPTSLCRWLCRLVTQPGGVVLDPFAGGGSVGKGALLEGFRFVGIEREPEYCELARARLEHALAQASDSGADSKNLDKTGS